MSQFFVGQTVGGPSGDVVSLSGNDLVKVYGDSTGNIQLLGASGITVTGNAGTFTETISLTNPTFSGTATTIGATTANINVTIPTINNSSTQIQAIISGYDTVTNSSVGGELLGLIKNTGGSMTVVGTDITKFNSILIFDATYTIVTSGTNAFVQVTGSAAPGSIINWSATIDVVSAS